MLAKVEVPYRIIDTAAGDLGSSAARKFDCEAWVLTQGRYRELTSTSNCTEYQARRLNIRERMEDGGTRPALPPERHAGHHPLAGRHHGEPPAEGRLHRDPEGHARLMGGKGSHRAHEVGGLSLIVL